jgi:signal peptidase
MSGKAAAGTIAVLLLVGLSLPLWSSMSYVVPRGASMEPRVTGGDLAIVRAKSTYRVGDVAAYRNTSLHRVVVHRIVGVDAAGLYTFKGDANDFVDPQQVSGEQIIGRLALSLPLLGGLLLWLSSPVNAVLLLAFVGLLVFDRERLLGAIRRPAGAPTAPATPATPATRGLEVDDDRLVPIRDMSFPHELAVADVVRPDSLLRLAERYDRPVLHDEDNGVLYVVESSMLFRCQLEQPVAAAAPLAVVRDLLPEAPAVPAPAVLAPAADVLPVVPAYGPRHERELLHNWPRRRDYGGRRKPSPHGRDWAYATGK